MADCNSCKTNKPDVVPYVVHESTMARMERQAKRLWITILVMIFLLVGTNCAWRWYESQFEIVEESTTIEAQQDGTGTNIVSGGDVGYGTDSQDNQEN